MSAGQRSSAAGAMASATGLLTAGGFVTYTKENKIATLGVPRKLIAAYTWNCSPPARRVGQEG
jgi:nicotinamide mononucleotide (NMN) deamidase PncC